MQIVIAKAEQTALVPTGRMTRRDGVNYFPEFRSEWEGKAAMWLRRGTTKDIAKAEQFASANGYTVFTYPTTERNPLEKAKTAVVESAR